MSRTRRLALVAAALAVAVAAFLILRPGDGGDSSPTSAAQPDAAVATTTPAPASTNAAPGVVVGRIRFAGGAPAGGVVTVRARKGQRVELRVTSDVADEVHVHGYDLKRDLAAGATARIAFPADIEGIFEVELEGRGVQLARLVVAP